MKEEKIIVVGMHCEGCQNRIENSLKSIDGIVDVKADYKTGLVTIKTNKKIDLNEVITTLNDIGFEIKEN